MKRFMMGSMAAMMVSTVWGLETFDFQDEKQNNYRLCSMTATQVLDPQSDVERVCRSFIERELNNSDTQKMIRTLKSTLEEEEISYFSRFMDRTVKTQYHHLLVLMKQIGSTFEPVGMGKVDLLEELEVFFSEETKKDLTEKVGNLSHGYCIGGNISQSYQNKGIVSAVSTQLLDIILHDIYKDRYHSEEPPYMFISTLLENAPMNRICVKMGLERITNDEGRKRGDPEHLVFSHEYIYRAK